MALFKLSKNSIESSYIYMRFFFKNFYITYFEKKMIKKLNLLLKKLKNNYKIYDKIILIFILLNKYFLKEIISLFLCVNVTHFNYEYY